MKRWLGIDALRGLAVLMMVAQHVTYWICGLPRSSWIVQITGTVGELAAPLFVTLAGVGVTLTVQRHSRCDRLLWARGCMLIGFGFLLNWLTPHWFSLQSWYVLHMIGLALVLAPLLRRAPSPALMAMILVVIVATVLIQTGLDTPLRLYNRDLAAPIKPGGILRFALAEGFFPVFPWIAFSMAGMLAGRWLLDNKPACVWQLAVGLLVGMGILIGLYATGWEMTRQMAWIRFFKWRYSFYPALMPITLFLIAAALFFIHGFVALDRIIALRSTNGLVCLGRASLSILIVHVVVVRESAIYFHFWRSLSFIQTLVGTSAIVLFFCVASVCWRKVNFRFGAEWLLRKVAGTK